jgi:oligopeptide transport system substrate-binding protein
LAGRRDKKRWDVARIGWTADYDDPTSFLDVFASGSSENDGSYLSPAFNESLNSAEMEPNGEKRTELLRRAEQSLLDDYPIVPIYFYNSRRLVKPDIGGATTTPMNRTYTKQLFWRAPP